MKTNIQMNSIPDLNINFLQSTEFEKLTIEQQKWADMQYKMLYAEQMSKVISQLERQKRIKGNLISVQKQQKQTTQQNYLKLKQKMQQNDKKRQMKTLQKTKTYKLQQQKWTRKIESIESKFKHQTRQAMEKAQKYRQQSESYWKNKQETTNNIRQANDQKLKMNRTSKMLLRNNGSNLDHSSFVQSKKQKYLALNMDFKSNKQTPRGLTSRAQLSINRTIDDEIEKHKQKSARLHNQKQHIIFQNAMKKLAKIQSTRQKAQKQRESTTSPTQIRHAHKREQDQKQLDYSSSQKTTLLNQSKSKQLLQNSILTHLKAKKMLEQQQFREGDRILENQHKRNRQDKIMKAIKTKIRHVKNSALKLDMYQ